MLSLRSNLALSHLALIRTLTSMPPKRPARPTTPPPKKKLKKHAKAAQTSIDSFFASPTKPKTPSKLVARGRENSVIDFIDSDEDDGGAGEISAVKVSGTDKGKGKGKEVEGDEQLARKLAEQWADEFSVKDEPRLSMDEDEIVLLEAPASSPGINGSSSSKRPANPIPANDKPKPVASIFAKPEPSTPKKLHQTIADVKPLLSPSKPTAITTSSSESVEPIDFDTDAFLFRPQDVDTSKWPKGRLPYSILVGVYVQVSSTRSRLIIVRVLTK
jgi:DNA ligase-1